MRSEWFDVVVDAGWTPNHTFAYFEFKVGNTPDVGSRHHHTIVIATVHGPHGMFLGVSPVGAEQGART